MALSIAQQLYNAHGKEFIAWYEQTFPHAETADWEPVHDSGWFTGDIMQGAWNTWIALNNKVTPCEKADEDLVLNGYKCPICQCTHDLNVIILTQAKLDQTDIDNIETDTDQAADRDHEWDHNSTMICGCGFTDKAKAFIYVPLGTPKK
jgi:hypothetical protein